MGQQLARSKEDILRCVKPLFSKPCFPSSTADLQTQAAYQTRFSVDLLYKEGLLSTNGYKRGLANLATALFEFELANVILARLSKGLLHSFFREAEANMVKVDRRTHLTVKLTSVLSWFLCRLRLPSILPRNLFARKRHQPSDRSPELPPLPTAIAVEAMENNLSVVEHVQELAWTVAATRKDMSKDTRLPTRQDEFPTAWDERGEPFAEEKTPMAAWIVKQLTRYRARSPFSAIGGNGDVFESATDIVTSTRNVMHLDMSCFPVVAHPSHSEEGLEPTNTWMLNFMSHGRIKQLWEDNSIGPATTHRLISKYLEAIKKATVMIKVFAGANAETDIVCQTFTRLAEEKEERQTGERGR